MKKTAKKPQVKAAKIGLEKPIPKNWKRKYRRVLRGKVHDGDIWQNAAGKHLFGWCCVSVGETIRELAPCFHVYRLKKGGAK